MHIHMHMRLRPAVRTRLQPVRHDGHRVAVFCKGLRLAGAAAGQSARVPECQSALAAAARANTAPTYSSCVPSPLHLPPPAPTCPRSCAASSSAGVVVTFELVVVKTIFAFNCAPLEVPCHAMPCHAKPCHAVPCIL